MMNKTTLPLLPASSPPGITTALHAPSLNKSQRYNILHSRHGLLVSGGVLLLRLLVARIIIRIV